METELKAAITGRGKLIIEAVQKMEQGKKLWQEGLLEFNNLTGTTSARKKGKTIANRTLRSGAPSLFRLEKRTDEQLEEKIAELVKKNPDDVSINTIHEKLHISERRAMRVIDRSKMLGFETDKSGKRTVVPKKAKKGKKTAANSKKWEGQFAKEGDPVDKIYSYIANHNWVNTTKIIKELGLEFANVKRCINSLVKDKRIKEVTKKENPVHKSNPGIFNREFQYWEAV